jgi:hypothetical protein
MRLELLFCQCIQKQVSSCGDIVPSLPHFGQMWCSRWLAKSKQFIQLRVRYFALWEKHKILLLLGSHVTDHPTDAIHGEEALTGIIIRNTIQAASKFTASKTGLSYECVRHIFPFLTPCVDITNRIDAPF